MTVMPDQGLGLVSRPVACLQPVVQLRAATGDEVRTAHPWTCVTGEARYELAIFADGGNRHAPEVVAALRGLFKGPQPPRHLIYVHCGQKAESMMPLMPSLLFAIGHAGPSSAIRIPDSMDEPEAALRISRFAQGQVPDKGTAVLVVDRQQRIGAPGRLTPAPVEISLLWRAATGPLRPAPLDRITAAERLTHDFV